MKKFFEQKNTSESKNGFTLIEVLLSIGIFSIGMLAVAALQARSLDQTRSAREATEAIALANGVADRLMAIDMYTTQYTVQNPDLVAGSHSETDITNRYVVRWTVRDDIPIGKQPNPRSTLLPDITVSKIINVEVVDIDNTDDVLSNLEFVKVLLD